MVPTAALLVMLSAAPAPDTAAAHEFFGASADSSRAETAPVPAHSSGFLPTLAIREACAKLEPDDVLRITGEFGTFVGRAGTISPEGLSGLRPASPEKPFSDLQREPSALAPVAFDHLDWSQVRRLERRTNPRVKGAVRGAALTTALVLAVVGYGYYKEGPSPDGPSLQGFALFFGLPAIAVGGILGGIIGATASPWEQVYSMR